jgi:hypothetical protein
MDTFLEIIQAVQSDNTVGDESSFLDLATVKLAINRAYINKVSNIFKWPQTEDAKLTSSLANHEYYDYPDYWRPNSIWKLVLDGEDFEDPLAFRDYEYEKEHSYPSGKQKIWSNKALRYFISPAPSADGDENIEVHGQKIPAKLVDDGDLTIFSLNMPELNEAIALEAKAILKAKGEELEPSQFASAEAKQICITGWGKLRQETAKYEKTLPQFNVPDFFGRPRTRDRIGNF